MNYGELKAAISDATHRKDMATRIPGFVDDARVMLNDRLTLALPPLTTDSATDNVLANNHLLYFYAAMRSFYLFIVEHETAATYNDLWEQQVEQFYVNRTGTEPLVITPEEPPA